MRNLIAFPNRVAGLSTWGWIAVAAIAVTAFSIAMRVVPHYLDNQLVKASVDRLPENLHNTMSKSDVYEHFQKQFRVENFPLRARDIIKIERGDKGTKLQISYEVREHVLGNADVVLVFHDEYRFD